MHLRLTQEHIDQTLLVKAQSLGVHLPSNTTTKACSTMKACHSMDLMVTEAMVVDSQSFETCQLGGILGSRTPPSSLSKEMQVLHRIFDGISTAVKMAFWFTSRCSGRYGYMGSRSSGLICNHYSVYLNIFSIDPAQFRRIHRVLNIGSSTLIAPRSSLSPCARCKKSRLTKVFIASCTRFIEDVFSGHNTSVVLVRTIEGNTCMLEYD